MTSVTLITPVYNALPWLGDFVGSVILQDFRPLQFIAVDDGSTDGSYDCLLGKKPRFKKAGIDFTLLRQAHAGQTAAVSRALPYVTGSFLTWCDADDTLLPGSISARVRWLKNHPEADMVRGNVIVEDLTEAGPPHKASPAKEERIEDIFDGLFREKEWGYSGAFMIRSESLFKIYPDRRLPDVGEGQNLQLLLPLASRSPCGFLPQCVSTYTRRPQGHSSRKLSLGEQLDRLEKYKILRERLLDFCECDKEYYKAISEDVFKRAREELLRRAALKARRSHG